MTNLKDKALLNGYTYWVLRQNYLKSMFDRGACFEWELDDANEMLEKLKNLILHRMTKATKVSISEARNE